MVPEAQAHSRELLDLHTASFKLALSSEVKIAFGTDCGMPPAPHGTNAIELEMMVRLGMSPLDVIRSATAVAAQALKMGERLGTIEKGKLADIIAVRGNPLADVKIFQKKENVALVMKEGNIYFNRL
jgi:imidazolonepropionase-like amidohydrolase